MVQRPGDPDLAPDIEIPLHREQVHEQPVVGQHGPLGHARRPGCIKDQPYPLQRLFLRRRDPYRERSLLGQDAREPRRPSDLFHMGPAVSR